ncbi:hypothetical protein [Ornithinimicrobium kibberense]
MWSGLVPVVVVVMLLTLWTRGRGARRSVGPTRGAWCQTGV